MAHPKKVILGLCALALGALLTEAFLRMLIPVEAQYETWFTPGIEQWDDTFGAVYRPEWKGTMRHLDGVYRGVPLHLDKRGYRRPARNALDGSPRRILMLGGRSAMMSYGLADNETVHARLVESLDFPAEAQSIASAGGNLLRDWVQYQKYLKEEPYDLVILSHVNPYLPAYKDHDAFDTLPPPPPREWVFRYMDGIVLWRDGLFLKTGRAAFQSYLGYGLVRIADAIVKASSSKERQKPSGLSQIIDKQAIAPQAEALADYTAFLLHVQQHFANRGIPVLVHLIPRPHATADHHLPYREVLDDSLDVVDMQARLHSRMRPGMFIANGHYGPELAALLGEELAAEVSARLSSGNP